MRICVIGAGLAGLVTAEALEAAGHEVIVVEARDRVGGRVWSRRLANGAWIERGAEFIEYGQTAVRELAARLEVPLAPTAMSYSDREPRGGPPVTHAELTAAVSTLSRAAVTSTGAATVHEVLERCPLTAGARAAITARIQVSFAHPVDALDARVLTHGAASFEGSQALRCVDGNQQLPGSLAALLRGPVYLNTPATAIQWTPSGVCVGTSKGGDIVADACVVTAPAAVWRRISFTPALPGWKVRALDDVVYAHAAKLAVPLRHTAAPSAILSVPDLYWTWTATRGRLAPDPVVNCFAGSQASLDRLGVAEGPDAWLDQLHRLRPDLEFERDQAVLSTWDDDPWVQAAYSTRAPTSDRDDGALQRSVGPLHFAGEHTATDWFALMEGAVRSGQRVAHEIITGQPSDAGAQGS